MSGPESTAFETGRDAAKVHHLKVRRLGIRTHQEAVVYMQRDCHVCRSEGLTPQSRVLLRNGRHEIIATLHQVSSDLIETDEAGLSEIAWERLAASEGDLLYASHPPARCIRSFEEDCRRLPIAAVRSISFVECGTAFVVIRRLDTSRNALSVSCVNSACTAMQTGAASPSALS